MFKEYHGIPAQCERLMKVLRACPFLVFASFLSVSASNTLGTSVHIVRRAHHLHCARQVDTHYNIMCYCNPEYKTSARAGESSSFELVLFPPFRVLDAR